MRGDGGCGGRGGGFWRPEEGTARSFGEEEARGGNPIGIVQEEEEGREERSDAERSGFTARIH